MNALFARSFKFSLTNAYRRFNQNVKTEMQKPSGRTVNGAEAPSFLKALKFPEVWHADD